MSDFRQRCLLPLLSHAISYLHSCHHFFAGDCFPDDGDDGRGAVLEDPGMDRGALLAGTETGCAETCARTDRANSVAAS
jgi:hypothetical protein